MATADGFQSHQAEQEYAFGKAKVTFANFDEAQKCYVKLITIDNDRFKLTMFKDSAYKKPYKEEIFPGSDVCGLDWGSMEKQKTVMKYLYKPVKTSTYVTIINKTKSISLISSGDEGEQLNLWRKALQSLLYGGCTYFREKLVLDGDKSVMLQVGRNNISITEGGKEGEPARRKASWNKEMFYDCSVSGTMMTLTLKSPNHPTATSVVLECQRGSLDGQKILSQEKTVKRIKSSLLDFVVCYWFTKQNVYEECQEAIYTDYGSDIYDLNKIEDVTTYGGKDQMKTYMHSVYQKVKDTECRYTDAAGVPDKDLNFTEEEKFVVNVGHVIQQIRTTPPLPDTLKLPINVRNDICVRLYTDSQLGKSNDWTALASQIGIKQGSVDAVKGILANERSIDPAAEIILRHWQFTYNRYWDLPESEYPDRPKLPCTKEGLTRALKNIGRRDLAQIVSGEVRYARGLSRTENEYEDVRI